MIELDCMRFTMILTKRKMINYLEETIKKSHSHFIMKFLNENIDERETEKK